MRAQKYSWDEMPEEAVTDTLSRKMVVGEKEMLCRLKLKPGCVVPLHSHEHEQIYPRHQGKAPVLHRR